MTKRTLSITIILIICLLPSSALVYSASTAEVKSGLSTSLSEYSTTATENKPQNTRTVPAKVAVTKPGFPKVRRTSAASLQLRWKRASGVNGYVIHRYNKARKKYVRVKTVRKSTVTKWTDRKLKTDNIYRYKLKSYKNINGKKVYSAYTYSISARTYSKSSKKVNAGSITARSRITIGLAGKSKVSLKIKPSKFGNARKKSVISKTIRFVSANSNVVVDGKKGRLDAKKVGTANVYAVAHNGNLKKIKVTVKDYARPTYWKNLNQVDKESRQVLEEYGDYLKDIASYFSTHKKSQNTILYLDDYGKLINEKGVPLGGIEDTVLAFLKNSPFDISIIPTNDTIHFELWFDTYEEPVTQTILYHYNYDFSELEAENDDMTKLAPQWFYWWYAFI